MDEKNPKFTPSEEEPSREPDYQAGDVTIANRSKAGQWLENIWYHYKFPIIASVILIVALAVCIAQCATRAPKPDYILCYAGATNLQPTATGTIRADIESSVGALLSERDLSGERVEVYHYLIRTDTAGDVAAANAQKTNIENLKNEFALANTYLFLLDEKLFDTYTRVGDDRYVVPVAPYLPGDSTVEVTPDGYGVYLRSTPIAALPGFSSLPEDTVLCLRVSYTLGSGKNSADTYARYEALFRAMLS